MTRALIVVTSTAAFDTIDRATGVWLSEAVHFHDAMQLNGVAVDYVSPRGGYVPVDPGSLAADAMDDACWRHYRDAGFRERYLADSFAPSEIDPDDYDVIYYAGGHGVMWDLPHDEEIAAVAESIHQRGGVVAGVCHGVVGLLAMRKPDGSPFVEGLDVAGFSDREEELNGLTKAVPFLAEDALRQAGANYSEGDPYTDHVVVDADARLVTGQNPQSAAHVAREVLKLL
ncbi:type 1 glutamine amidotransferase domain-containing protein [Bifidobacterium choloepi]|uniref:Type 1 glutamine amidotransferase domain-containing protein n=1 Tax=Bifidobacterium choloepi TaxID=2614131 RepID=A0A6I5NCT2_9BIFI|nr:type 1 glutamine amidotransferase domain-containing protein [Bifidobacterium choloepi]NEG69274.1 type 1 glutamine amidotransferase domain-containing protein [Bifidobacterium choloepi]